MPMPQMGVECRIDKIGTIEAWAGHYEDAATPVTVSGSAVPIVISCASVKGLLATGTNGVFNRIVFYADGAPVAEIRAKDGSGIQAVTGSFTGRLDSTKLTNGAHTLNAVAYDLKGNTSCADYAHGEVGRSVPVYVLAKN
jgi:hypothetical protein